MDAEALVCVVEDDAPLRASLQDLLQSVGLRVMAFASAHAFLDHPPPEGPGCLVLDVRLPGLSGLELQQRLAAAGRDLPIIFLTGHGDIPMTVQALQAGAVAFLTKPVREQALLDAVQQALARDRQARAQRAQREALRRRYDALTPREREVMAGVVAGRLNKQIAAELGTSEASVKVHRQHVMAKMAAGSLPALVRMADRLGLPIPTLVAAFTKVSSPLPKSTSRALTWTLHYPLVDDHVRTIRGHVGRLMALRRLRRFLGSGTHERRDSLDA